MKGRHAVILIFLLGLLPLAGCAKQPVLLEVPDVEAITETPIQQATAQPVVTTTLGNTEQPPPQTVTEPDLQTEIPVSQNEEQQESQQSSTVLSQTERWYAGTLLYRGVSIAVNGFVQPDFPTPMKQIRLAGAGLGKKTILNALQTYFDLHSSFALQGAEEYYVNFTALDSDGDRSTTTNQDSLEFDASFRTDDHVIGLYYEKCMECLRGLGIQGMRNVGLGAYFDHRRIIPPEAFVQASKQTLHIVIPYVIDGLSTEYQNMIVSRSLIEDSDSTARHIMDYPFAGFTFDSQFRLIGMSMSFYQVEVEKTIQGQPISWQQAVTAALDFEISDRYHMGRGELTADEYFDVFFQTYTVRVIRVFPMWMPGWMNGCLPGWCVQLQLYDKQTGEFRLNYALAVSAQTGEVIQNRHRED